MAEIRTGPTTADACYPYLRDLDCRHPGVADEEVLRAYDRPWDFGAPYCAACRSHLYPRLSVDGSGDEVVVTRDEPQGAGA